MADQPILKFRGRSIFASMSGKTDIDRVNNGRMKDSRIYGVGLLVVTIALSLWQQNTRYLWISGTVIVTLSALDLGNRSCRVTLWGDCLVIWTVFRRHTVPRSQITALVRVRSEEESQNSTVADRVYLIMGGTECSYSWFRANLLLLAGLWALLCLAAIPIAIFAF